MEEVRELSYGHTVYYYKENDEVGNMIVYNHLTVFVDKDGFVHNINDEPTWIEHCKIPDKDYIQYKGWCYHGKEHRETGPSSIWYNKDGSINSERYFLDNIELSNDEFEIHTNRMEILNEL